MPNSSRFSLSDEALIKLLHDNEFVAEAALEKAQTQAQKSGSSLYETLIQQDAISDDNLGQAIADNLNLPFVRLNKQTINSKLLNLIPENVASHQQSIIFGEKDNQLQLATALPENQIFLQMVAHKTNKSLKLYYATPRDIEQSLRGYKRDLSQVFKELLEIQVADATNSDASTSAPTEVPVTKIVDTLITYAYENHASDVHIEPNETYTVVRFRLDGVLQDVLQLPATLHDQVITRIKVLSKLRTDEHLSAQDGKFQAEQKAETIDVRVSVIPVVEGEKAVLRLLSSHYRQFTLQDLGMSEVDLTKIKTAIEKPYGMILSTGPTGSGKTTSMYAILKLLNVREKNIATIEDPVEYEIAGLNQIQVNPKTNLTFAAGLKSILRQDPDIMYVGEIRDEETADIAVNSATTGHLVLSTLHTNNAATTIPRLIDMKIEPFLIATTVNVIIGQRLVRMICSSCKVSQTVPRTEVEAHFSPELVNKYFGKEAELQIYHGQGCPVCHKTGFVGRVGIFEVMSISPAIQELINKKVDSGEIHSQALSEGMASMMEDGLSKVQLGLTTIEEVLRATKE